MATYTTNYQLHQWEAEDDFLRTDFNEDFAKIDAAIKGVETEADSKLAKKADKTALTALTTTVNGKAEVDTGRYTGNGDEQTITLGYTPSAVVVNTTDVTAVMATYALGTRTISIVTNGFRVSARYTSGSSPNESGTSYSYFALR
mgnify:FL=1